MRNKLFFLLFCATSLFGIEQTEILFYLQDAGETYALLPVIQKLEEKEVNYLVLAAGVAEETFLKNNLPKERIRTFQDFGLAAPSERNELFKIDAIVKEIIPKEVVTGVAYELQGDLLAAYAQKGIPTFAYWDNFNADGDNPYFQTAHKVEQKAAALLLPCHSLEAAFSHRKGIKVVGQPTLDRWKEEVLSANREEIRKKFQIPAGKKVALFVGGYGKEYEEAFQLFLQAADNTDFFFLFNPIPNCEDRMSALSSILRSAL